MFTCACVCTQSTRPKAGSDSPLPGLPRAPWEASVSTAPETLNHTINRFMDQFCAQTHTGTGRRVPTAILPGPPRAPGRLTHLEQCLLGVTVVTLQGRAEAQRARGDTVLLTVSSGPRNPS